MQINCMKRVLSFRIASSFCSGLTSASSSGRVIVSMNVNFLVGVRILSYFSAFEFQNFMPNLTRESGSIMSASTVCL